MTNCVTTTRTFQWLFINYRLFLVKRDLWALRLIDTYCKYNLTKNLSITNLPLTIPALALCFLEWITLFSQLCCIVLVVFSTLQCLAVGYHCQNQSVCMLKAFHQIVPPKVVPMGKTRGEDNPTETANADKHFTTVLLLGIDSGMHGPKEKMPNDPLETTLKDFEPAQRKNWPIVIRTGRRDEHRSRSKEKQRPVR